MNIALVSSQGGHSGQMKIIFKDEVLKGNNAIFITEKPGKKVFSEENAFNGKFRTYYFPKDILLFPEPFRYIKTMFQLIKIFKKEKIDLIITNGAQISIPAVIGAKLLGIKTIFMETVIRVKTTTWSAKVCYPFVDKFIVQHPWMAEKYGKKAEYHGGIL